MVAQHTRGRARVARGLFGFVVSPTRAIVFMHVVRDHYIMSEQFNSRVTYLCELKLQRTIFPVSYINRQF